MPSIELGHDDYLILVRALAFAEFKAIRLISDLFGDELRLGAETVWAEEPLTAAPGEIEAMARRAGGFFNLDPVQLAPLAAQPTLGDWAAFLHAAIGPRPQAVTFYTSGSTGEPKPVYRPFAQLEQDAAHLAGMLAGARRLVSLVPPHHIYGFIYTMLIPKALGVPCVNMRFKRPSAIVRELGEGDAVIGIPALWKLCAETRERFPATTIGVTSTAPCPPEVIRTLRRQGLPVMHEIYGSSECGAMGHRASPDDPMTLMPAWRRVGEDRFARALPEGGLSEPFIFQDTLRWVDETHFHVEKRLDHAVQVAGVNVFPARVREALLAHPGVADCVVRLMRPEEGERLKAFVVPGPGHAPGPELLNSLRTHLAGLLTPLEQPKSILFGESLPQNEMGKPADWTIRPGRIGMTRDQALEMLGRDVRPVADDQPFTADVLRPEDAWGVARLFYAVHGPSFPFETYYIPERLLEENRMGLVHSAVARTPCGDIVGYGSLFRSSAPYHGVYEIGAHVILPAYSGGRAARMLQEYLRETLIPQHGVEVFFSEAPCRHVVTQKFAAMSRLVECALEIGLMPASYYGAQDAPDARVSTLLLFGAVQDARRTLHCPDVYRESVAYLLEGLGIDRATPPADETPPSGLATRASVEHFEFAQVARMHVASLGGDFPAALDAFETQAGKRGARVMQVFLNLGQAWNAEGVELLRSQGYFLGGLLPRWFDDDGLLMQRVLDMPDVSTVKLYSQRAHRILDRVLRDIESNPACGKPKRAARRVASGPGPLRPGDMAEVVAAGQGMTIEEVVAVARHGRPVRLTRDRSVLGRVDGSAGFIEWAVRTGEPIYGVNTGFGGMANVAVGEADLAALQNNLLRFLNVCAGDYLPAEDVRAAMLLRANSHMRGASGVRRELIERLLIFLNNDVVPRVRSMGSIGASGDLAPLASIAGALVGADDCFQVVMAGEAMSCREALARLGLAPLPLGPKEGLGMVNGTSVMTGIAANCFYDARRLVALALGFHALAVQALRGSNQSFHPFIQELKPHPGQKLVAAIMLELLDGSRMCRDELDGHHEDQGGQPVQDRYSLRCLPQFLGPVSEGLGHVRAALEIEMNSANDNPLIDGENCLSLHSGNFLGQHVGVWMDHLRYYLGLMAKHMDAQIALLAAPEFSVGLPASLVGNTGRAVNMGLKGLQIAANSIMPLLSYYGMPIADRFPTHAEQFNQNINSQGFNAAILARRSLRALEPYVAMALVFGVQAVSLRAKAMAGSFDPRPLLSPPTCALHDAVMGVLGHDRTPDRPLVWNDDEQSLEVMIQTLQADIAGDGATADAMAPVLAALP
jgi:phenylalanine ammonia-lyase